MRSGRSNRPDAKALARHFRVSEIGCWCKETTFMRARQISHPDKIPDKINKICKSHPSDRWGYSFALSNLFCT